LVELLVVVAIVAIVASMILGGIKRMRHGGTHSAPPSAVRSPETGGFDRIVVVNGHTYEHAGDCPHPWHGSLPERPKDR